MEAPRHCYDVGPFTLDIPERHLSRGGEIIKLQPKTFDLLTVLVEHAGRAVSRADLLEAVWPGTFIEDGILAVHISTLRKALDSGDGATAIETVPKLGYRLVLPVRRREQAPRGAATAPDPAATLAGGSPAVVTPPGPRRLWRRMAAAIVALAAGLATAAWLIDAPTPPMRAIAVLPFVSIAPAEDAAYFEIGMADAIIARLGSVDDLRVLPTASVRRLANDPRAPAEIGRALGVDGVITGTLQRADDRVRVTMQLTRIRDGARLWAGRFDERFVQIFALQDAIAEQVVRQLLDDVALAAPRQPTTNVEAYELYIRARESWARRTPETIRTAIALYEKAIGIDPQFALAYAGLADAYAITVSGLPAAERFPKARAAVERALALDPDLAEAHNTRAFLAYKIDWRWADAERDFKRAIELNPRYGLTYHWYGEFLGLLARRDEALAIFEKAREADPYSIAIINDMTAVCLAAGQVARARRLIETGLHIDPNDPRMVSAMGRVITAEGNPDDGFEWIVRARMMTGGGEQEIAELRAAYAAEGFKGLRRRDLARYQAALSTPSPSLVNVASNLALAYADLGDREAALTWLERAVERHEDGPLQMRTAQPYAWLRGDPRFRAIEAAVFAREHDRAGRP